MTTWLTVTHMVAHLQVLLNVDGQTVSYHHLSQAANGMSK